MTWMLFSARKCCTTSDVWLGALSWYRSHSEHTLHWQVSSSNRQTKLREWICERCQILVPIPRWSFFSHIESVVILFQSGEFWELSDCPTYIFTPPICPHGIYSENFILLLTPWHRVLLEKLTGLQLVKKFPAFHGTRRFITALTSVRHLSKHPACECFLTKFFYREGLLAPRPTPSWRTTPRRLSATAYSIYSQLPSLSEAIPLSATSGHVMPWWQGPFYQHLFLHKARSVHKPRICICTCFCVVGRGLRGMGELLFYKKLGTSTKFY